MLQGLVKELDTIGVGVIGVDRPISKSFKRSKVEEAEEETF